MSEIREKRWHPLLQEWVIIAESTSQRPWNGEKVNIKLSNSEAYDSTCYLCPSNQRSNGLHNPAYQSTWSFVNDYASFSKDYELSSESAPPFSMSKHASGICKVLVYHPNHHKTLADLELNEIQSVIEMWKNEYESFLYSSEISYVLIFENKGEIIGVSNPHPHGQLYATDFVPKNIEAMAKSFTWVYENSGDYLLQEILKFELNEQKRIVCENNDWVVIVPYFAQFAYETYILPKRFFQHIGHLHESEIENLAIILNEILNKYDQLFGFSLPNIMNIFNSPLCNGKQFKANHFQFFIRFSPPLREADKLKYLAGFESGTNNIINPLAPEKAALILRNL